jgi:hypothetical protein
MMPPQKRIKTNDAVIESWDMIANKEGLAGAQIGIEGLKQTNTDALVRIKFSDGSIHRVVLRPTQTTTTIPDPLKTEDNQNKSQSFLLLFDRWRYVVLTLAAFALSLSSAARRK